MQIYVKVIIFSQVKIYILTALRAILTISLVHSYARIRAHHSEELNLIYLEAFCHSNNDSDIQHLEEKSDIDNQEIIIPIDATDAGFEVSSVYRLIDEIKTLGIINIDKKKYSFIL